MPSLTDNQHTHTPQKKLANRVYNIGRRKKQQRHIYGSQPPPPMTKTDVTHKRKQNEIQRCIHSFRNRRPGYVLGSTAADALTKIFHDLNLESGAQTASAISKLINEAKTIREERKSNRITRREQLEKVRSLQVDLAITFDRNHVRDGEVVLKRLYDLVKATPQDSLGRISVKVRTLVTYAALIGPISGIISFI